VIQVHPDAESFEYHLKLFGERVQGALDYIDVEGVEIYAPPSPFVEQLVRRDWDANYRASAAQGRLHPCAGGVNVSKPLLMVHTYKLADESTYRSS
jgi:hypothetical protein